MRIEIRVGIASKDWAFAVGDVIDESHPHYTDALLLTRGPCAVLVEDEAPREERATAPEAPERATARRKR